MANNQIRNPQFSRVLSDTESVLRSTDIGPLESLMHKYMASGLTQSAREQNAFNAREAEEAYNRQVDFYDSRQSAPAMVEQYKQAGINPALVSGYSPSSPPTSEAASGNGGNPSGDILGLLVNLFMRNKEFQLQKSLVDAEVDLKNAQAGEARSRTVGQDIDNMSKERYNELRNESMLATINNILANTKNTEQNTLLQSFQTAIYKSDSEVRDKLNKIKVDLAEAQYQYQLYQNDMTKFELEHQQQRFDADIANIWSSTALNNAHASQIREYCQTMLESPYIDEKGRAAVNRLAAMSDAEIERGLNYNKASWVHDYLHPIGVALGGILRGAAMFGM